MEKEKEMIKTYRVSMNAINQKEYVQHHVNTLMTSWQFCKKTGID